MSSIGDTPGIPAAWYPDPLGDAGLRWWDGTGWTEHVRPAVEPVRLTTTAPAVVAAPAVVPAYVPMSSFTWEDAASTSPAASSGRAQPVPEASTLTVWLWLYSLTPILQIISFWVVISVADDISGIVRGVFVMVSSFAAILLVMRDRAQLSEWGHTPPPVWMFLFAPVYMIVRAARVSGLSLLPLLVWGVAVVVTVVAILAMAFSGTVDAARQAQEDSTFSFDAPLTETERLLMLSTVGAEAKIRHELLSQDIVVDSIECQPFPSIATGATTTCVVMLDDVELDLTLEVQRVDPTVFPFVIMDADGNEYITG